jgi:hypothetical protein
MADAWLTPQQKWNFVLSWFVPTIKWYSTAKSKSSWKGISKRAMIQFGKITNQELDSDKIDD